MKLLKMPEDESAIRKVASHTALASLLVPSPRESDIAWACEQAKKFGLASVIATPFDCPAVMKRLEGSGVETECLNALNHALDENFETRMEALDILIGKGIRHFEQALPCGLMRENKFDVIEYEMAQMTKKIHAADATVSFIAEPDVMRFEDMKQIAHFAGNVGADYVRLGSGFEKVCGTNGGRATIRNICFLREQLPDSVGLKTGGGWEYAFAEDCLEYLECGAVRTDAGPRLIEQLEQVGFSGR